MDCVTPMLLWCSGVVDMDVFSPRHLVFASQKSFTSGRKSLNSVFSRSICSRFSVSRFRIRAKRSRFQGTFLHLMNMDDLFDHFHGFYDNN